MARIFKLKPLSAAVSTVLASSALAIPTTNAEENPFQMTKLSSGYMVAGGHKEGKCGEGKCGMKMMDADKDGAVSKEEFMQHHEMKFDKKDKNKDGQLTTDEMKVMKRKMHEGKCGGMKMKEGKCGEGKCGGGK